MRYLVILILGFLLQFPSQLFAYDLLVLQSQRSPVYDEVMRGVRSVVKCTQRIIVLSEYNDVDLQRVVREEKPLVILTLGDNALSAARKVNHLPIVSLMSLNYRTGMSGYPALTGVEVQIPPENYLSILAAIKSRKVGIIANTARNSVYLKQAHRHALRYGIDLVVRDVKSPKDVIVQLASLNGNVDALWMLPDISIATGETSDAFFLFAANRRLPVISFSSNYLAFGSAIILEMDRYDIGKQGGEMVSELLVGTGITNVTPAAPRKHRLKINPVVLQRVGISPELSVFKDGN